MKRALPATLFSVAAAAVFLVYPAVGQHADHQGTPSASTPAPGSKPADSHAGHDVPAPTPTAPSVAPAATHDHGGAQSSPPNQPSSADHAGHVMPVTSAATGADLPVGHDAAPPSIPLGAADSVFGPDAMAQARGVLASEHGGAFLWKVMIEQAEYRAGPHGAAYGWDAEAWFGGDIHRLVLKTEGEGESRGLEEAEWQALYSRAIGPYTDVQLGVRQDVAGYVATYGTFGVEAVLPYWFKADAALFVSGRGDVLARLQGSYDLLLTQQIVLQPGLELNFAMQDIPAATLAGGLTDITAGLRVRYDLNRKFSPYLGFEYARKVGGTESLYRAMGVSPESMSFVMGVRTFF